LFALAWFCTGQWWPVAASDERIACLAGSSLAGLVLGDIGFFYALATIGPRVSSVVMATWPGITVAIEIGLGRTPGPLVLVGIVVTMAGVALVLLRSREGTTWNPGLTRRQWGFGLLGAMVGAAGQAVGFILAGYGMQPGADLPSGLDPLLATVVRMATGVVGLQCVAFAQRRPLAARAVFGNRLAMRAALLGALCGPVGGVWLSMVSRAHAADAGVAAALMATTPIFMMPVAALVYGARVGWLGLVGTLLAVGGAALCFLAPAR
jgi:drug/metabolite transporter (DMT)-like permease